LLLTTGCELQFRAGPIKQVIQFKKKVARVQDETNNPRPNCDASDSMGIRNQSAVTSIDVAASSALMGSSLRWPRAEECIDQPWTIAEPRMDASGVECHRQALRFGKG